MTKHYRVKLRELTHELKNVPCADCGVRYPPYVMQFDHVRGIKKANVAWLVNVGTFEQVLEEVSKCEIVCANCHSERTHKRKMG
jgi:hypothetical protein